MQIDTKSNQAPSLGRMFGRLRIAISAMLTVVAITGTLLAVTASPAAADASACTPARDTGFACGVIQSGGVGGLYIQQASMWRNKPDYPLPGNVCHYTAIAKVYDSGGSLIFQKRGPDVAKCDFLVGSIDISGINRYFPNNSTIALSFYEYGVRQATISFRITG